MMEALTKSYFETLEALKANKRAIKQLKQVEIVLKKRRKALEKQLQNEFLELLKSNYPVEDLFQKEKT